MHAPWRPKSAALGAIALLLIVTPAGAHAAVVLQEGAPIAGHIRLIASADPPPSDLRIYEQTEAGDVEVASGTGESRIPWTCQTTRTFAAVADGERTGPLTVTTPSCATRLELRSARRVWLGDAVRVSLFDKWHQGNLQADVCATAPGRPETCEHVDLPAHQWIAHVVFRATTPGKWRVVARGPAQTAKRSFLVVREHYPGGLPTILTTGDSMMLATRDALRRDLRHAVRPVDDTYVGSGISRPFVIDWLELPKKQVKAYRPDATVITLGMEDGRDLDGFACCGPDWITAYAKRVRIIMKTYLRGGRGAVVWLNEPFQRRPERAPHTRAVNAAYPIAARGLARVKIVDLNSVFTPGGKYRARMKVGGRTRRVRAADGVHFNELGGRIASRLAVRALRDLGVRIRRKPRTSKTR